MLSGVTEITCAAKIQRRGREGGWRTEGFLRGDVLSWAFKDMGKIWPVRGKGK